VTPAREEVPVQRFAFVLLSLSLTATATTAVPVRPNPQRAELHKHWGEPVDPDHDCTFRLVFDRLHLAIPGKPHVLAAELGQTNGPRVLRAVEGDFAAEVRVSGPIPADPRCLVPGRWAFYGTGLVLWQDDKNYVRLERACIHYPDGAWRGYPNWECRSGGAVARGGGVKDGALDAAKGVCLRLVRRAAALHAAYRPDGAGCKELPPIQADFDVNLRVGVVALQNTASGYEAIFEGLRIGPAGPVEPR
jgi:regulation of enolase protein 1 (concanavalin A-like superfamily)